MDIPCELRHEEAEDLCLSGEKEEEGVSDQDYPDVDSDRSFLSLQLLA